MRSITSFRLKLDLQNFLSGVELVVPTDVAGGTLAVKQLLHDLLLATLQRLNKIMPVIH